MGMTPDEISAVQQKLGLSDNKMAKALGVTRQTWRNWRTGKACPPLAQNAIRWLMELRKISPANDNLPDRVRFFGALLASAVIPGINGLLELAP